jgi:hypothetical protein
MEALNTDQFWEIFLKDMAIMNETINSITSTTCTPDMILTLRTKLISMQHFATDAARY